ncbi:hypothetical protein PFLU3_34930 [Pseudomonas fluorescens]|uniref:Uncharacterized protein n=1 Tax=Pseudomonas fluorescens TaxID=294 RepID=A0A0D0RND5_PSEFL|nr:hypothetical protein PFLU3_34930 [Pseudomonas fluorescens]
MLDAGSKALGVAILDQNIGRRMGQETLELLRAALDRQVQAVRRKDHASTGSIKAQVVGKHHLVIVTEVRLRTAQLNGEDGDSTPCQPTGNPVHDHPVGEIGERTLRLRLGFEQDDLRQALLANQLRGHALKHQRQKTQARFQACGQAGLRHGGATQERQAAGFELTRVHAEELIVRAPRQQAPQPRIGRGRNPGAWLLQQCGINPDLA